MHGRRVVVTGLGAITPLGTTVGSFWDGLVAGCSAVRTIANFDASPFEVRFGAECRDFAIGDFVEHRISKRMDRFAQLAAAAAKEAVESSGFHESEFDPTRAGVSIGSGIGGLKELEEQHRRLLSKGPGKVSAFTIPKLMANAASGHISIQYNLQGTNTAMVTACASAGHAMGDAYSAIRENVADVVVTGGSEAALTPLGVAAFAAMRALSTRNDDPEHASRPFDRDRDGFVLGEGAGILVFEEYERARRRGANILCEVIGFGATGDAGDMVQPDPEGRGAARAMAAAIAAAELKPEQIDYINAHGTGTPLGDVAETRAIKSVFGSSAKQVAVSSTKSCIGHLLGASGGVEAIACINALNHKVLPPTINLDNPDPDCDLDYVPNTARDADVKIAMSNSFGFGGHNACVIFRTI